MRDDTATMNSIDDWWNNVETEELLASERPRNRTGTIDLVLKLAAFGLAFAFVWRIWTLQVDFSAPVSNEVDSTDVALLRSQVQQLQDTQGALLETVYFGLGSVLAIGALLVGYGWFQNRDVLERYRIELRETKVDIGSRLRNSDKRQRSYSKRTRRELMRQTTDIDSLKAARRDVERELQRIVQRIDLLNQFHTLTRASDAVDQIGASLQRDDAGATLRHAATLLASFDAPPELRQFFVDFATDAINKALDLQTTPVTGRLFTPLMKQLVTLLEMSPSPEYPFLRNQVIERLKDLLGTETSDTEASNGVPDSGGPELG